MKRDLVTIWHPFFTKINEDTRVLCVGEDTDNLGHVCKKKNGMKTIILYKATHNTAGAGHCSDCNTLFLGKDSL